LWPMPERRLSRRLRVNERLIMIENEALLSNESHFFERLFQGGFREGSELVMDFSDVPVFQRNPALIDMFFMLVMQQVSLEQLGDDHLALTVELLELSHYFEAPRLEDQCIEHLLSHLSTILSQPSPTRDTIPKLPWVLVERMMTSVEDKTDAIILAGVWCDSSKEDEMSEYLHRRFRDLSGMEVVNMTRIGRTCPHMLAKLPSKAVCSFFERLDSELEWVSSNFAGVIQEALPQVLQYHRGAYRTGGTDAGWTCCGVKRKRTSGCALHCLPGIPLCERRDARNLKLLLHWFGAFYGMIDKYKKDLDDAVSACVLNPALMETR